MPPGRSDHRPWPPPRRPWALAMRWHDLLFLHWPLPPGDVRPLLPPSLRLDTFDGRAWIGVIPFRMTGVRLRLLPPLPGAAAFSELNVRTYVEAGGKPGVWFFSLDAASRIAVRAARRWFGLPYHDARMRVRARGEGVEYRSVRTHPDSPPAGFHAVYAPAGPERRPAPDDLDAWLTERYCLYARDRRGRLRRGEIHHAPWPLQAAEVEVSSNTMTAPLGLQLPDAPPLARFARRLDVVAWAPRRVEG